MAIIVPTPTPIIMVTMTVGYILNKFINLKVLSFIELDDVIIGLKCDSKIKGAIKIKTSKKVKKTKDFKNQCTFIIRATWLEKDIYKMKLINAKLFNNGKLIFTGCTNLDQVHFALDIITKKIMGLNSSYTINPPINNMDIIKKDIILNNSIFNIIHSLLYSTEFDINSIDYDEYCTINKIIHGIKAYYNLNIIGLMTKENIMDFPLINTIITDHSPLLPSYIDNDKLLIIEPDLIKILNINSRMSCGFSIKKTIMCDLLKADEHIKNIYYDENIYPGIKAQYQSKTDTTTKLEIIFFNSGKINITSTQTFEQITEIYDFIVNFCRIHFMAIHIECDKDIIDKKYLECLPNTYTINSTDVTEPTYVLLKKQFITTNKRNKFIISKFNYDKYFH